MQLPLSHWFGIWRERAVAFDPGLTNLLLASRAVASVMLTLLVLYILTQLTGQPPTLLLLGGAMSMFSVMAINDETYRAQAITSVLLPLPAMASLTVGGLLSPWRFIDDGVFVIVIFFAVFVRRFGPRAFAFGMLAFIAYFIGTILHPDVAALPWFFAAICVGFACSFLMRQVILTERPKRALKRMLRTIIALTGRTLDEVIKSLQERPASAYPHRTLRHYTERLNEAAISAESQLEKVLPGDQHPNPARTRLALAVLDLQLRTERVVVTCTRSTDPEARQRALHALLTLRGSIRTRSLATANEAAAITQLQQTTPERAVRNLATALASLSAARVNTMALADSQLEIPASAQTETQEADTQSHDPKPRDRFTAGLSVNTRQAIQAAIASILAIAAGELISPHRWYWAAIAAFVVFTGTNSRGELLVKGWQRMAGTGLGVIAGVVIGTAAQGYTYVEVALMFFCIFMGFYLLRLSYALMIFWITIMVAMVYTLLGFFSDELLLVRLEETAVGVAAGTAVAVLLLPMSVRSRAAADSREYLHLLADVVTSCGERLVNEQAGGNLPVKARALDRQFQQLLTTAQPLTRGIAGAFARKGARRWVRSLMACRYYAASLARATQHTPVTQLHWRSIHELSGAIERISDNIRILSSLDENADTSDIQSASDQIEQLMDALPADDECSSHAEQQWAILDNLGRIDRLVITLARDFGSQRRR